MITFVCLITSDQVFISPIFASSFFRFCLFFAYFQINGFLWKFKTSMNSAFSSIFGCYLVLIEYFTYFKVISMVCAKQGKIWWKIWSFVNYKCLIFKWKVNILNVIRLLDDILPWISLALKHKKIFEHRLK